MFDYVRALKIVFQRKERIYILYDRNAIWVYYLKQQKSHILIGDKERYFGNINEKKLFRAAYVGFFRLRGMHFFLNILLGINLKNVLPAWFWFTKTKTLYLGFVVNTCRDICKLPKILIRKLITIGYVQSWNKFNNTKLYFNIKREISFCFLLKILINSVQLNYFLS
jgi:hypothetical protein